MTRTVKNVGPALVALTLAMITTGGPAIAAVGSGSLSASAASSPGVSNPGIYGPGIGYDTKANIQVGPHGQKMAIRFKATATSALNSVRFVQRGGAGYSLGSGGTMTLSVRADDGAGHPSATSLAQQSYTPGNPGGEWEKYDPVTFSSPATLTVGAIYYIVFTNASTSNYISVNSVYCYNSIVPRQEHFSDAEYGLMITTGSWGALEAGYTPVLDLTYANGAHDGQSYYAAMIDKYVNISSSTMVREHLTVSGGNRSVVSASVRLRRTSGTSPLIVTLQTEGGTLIESVSIPAARIPISAPGGDNGGSVWVTADFTSAHVLANGVGYGLRMSTASGTTYTMFPILAGPDDGLNSYFFADGTAESTTNSGTNWAKIYKWNHTDLQTYFTLAPAAATSPIQFGRIQYNSPGTDTTANASVNGEYVVIRNLGYTARSLTGWIVRDAQNHVYRFGTFTLGARKSVVLRTGKGTNTSTTRYWGSGYSGYHVWNNTGDRAYLRTAAGTGMDYCAWTTSGVGYKIC